MVRKVWSRVLSSTTLSPLTHTLISGVVAIEGVTVTQMPRVCFGGHGQMDRGHSVVLGHGWSQGVVVVTHVPDKDRSGNLLSRDSGYIWDVRLIAAPAFTILRYRGGREKSAILNRSGDNEKYGVGY